MEKIFSPIFKHSVHSLGFKFGGEFKRCNNFIYRKTFYTVNLFHDLGNVYRSIAFMPSNKEINMNDHTFMLKFNNEYVKFMDIMGILTADKKKKLIDTLFKYMKDNRKPGSVLDNELVSKYIVYVLNAIINEYNREEHVGAFFTPKCFIMGQYIENSTGNVYPVYYVLNNYNSILSWLKQEVLLLGNEHLEIDQDGNILKTDNVSTHPMSESFQNNLEKWLINFNDISILESRENQASEEEKIAYKFIMTSLIDMLKIENNSRMEFHHA